METTPLINRCVALHSDISTSGVRSLMGDLEASDLPVNEVRLTRKHHGVHHVAIHVPATAAMRTACLINKYVNR